LKRIMNLFCLLIVAGWSVNSNAGLISANLTVSATDWDLLGGAGGGPSVDPVVLDFSIFFDNSADITNATSGLVINNPNLASSSFLYGYDALFDRLSIATESAVPSGCGWSSPGLCTIIEGISTATPSASSFGVSDTTGSYTARDISVDRVQAPSPVPVPATIALLGLGLASLGWSRRKKA
jgi:hypothetical protein